MLLSTGSLKFRQLEIDGANGEILRPTLSVSGRLFVYRRLSGSPDTGLSRRREREKELHTQDRLLLLVLYIRSFLLFRNKILSIFFVSQE